MFISKCILIPYIAGISVILNYCYNKIQMQPSTIYSRVMYVSLLSFQIVFHMPVWTNSTSLGISEGRTEVVELLLKYGSSINTLDMVRNFRLCNTITGWFHDITESILIHGFCILVCWADD